MSEVSPCPCECNSGGWCGGCGHAGCANRRTRVVFVRDDAADVLVPDVDRLVVMTDNTHRPVESANVPTTEGQVESELVALFASVEDVAEWGFHEWLIGSTVQRLPGPDRGVLLTLSNGCTFRLVIEPT